MEIITLETPTRILPNIFIGSWLAAKNVEAVLSLDISGIVNMSLEHPTETLYSFPVLRMGLHDEFEGGGINTDEQIRAAVDAFEGLINDGRKVLSHCNAGRNRSASVIAGYLVKSGKQPNIPSAYEFIAGLHPLTCPTKMLAAHMERLYPST